MKVVSWDGNNINDGTNYTAGIVGDNFALPDVFAEVAPRSGAWPLVSEIDRPGRMVFVQIEIKNATASTYRKQLHQWFDPEDETAKQLIIEDDDGTGDRYVLAVCERLEDVSSKEGSGSGAGVAYLAHLRVHGDVRWRETAGTTDSWSVSTDADTDTWTNNGADDAYPVITITPTGAKGSGYTKRRQSFVRWKIATPYAMYPIDITAASFVTSDEIASTDMQSDGDDLRVYVDGSEVNRWLANFPGATSSVWINLDMYPAMEGTISTAVTSDASPTTITLSAVTMGSMIGFPPVGTIIIDSEAFTYTSRNVQKLTFSGVTRAALGTTAAAHLAGATAWWMQHNIELLYGDSDAADPTTDDADYDDRKPIFTLASSNNGFWDYDEFGDNAGLRTGAWRFVDGSQFGISQPYGGNQSADADPWAELGIEQGILGNGYATGWWELYNPCVITNIGFENGEKRSESNISAWTASIRSRLAGQISQTTEVAIAAPTTEDAWESWSDTDEALTADSVYVLLYLQRDAGVPGGLDQYLEAADAYATFDTDYIPEVTLGDEVSIYPLNCTLTNATTSDDIQIQFLMQLDQTLEIDTAAKTVTYLKDNSNQLQALTLLGGPRKDWFKLVAGANTIQFAETGATALTIGVEWEERHYS